MRYFKNFDWSIKSILKALGLFLLLILGITLLIGLITISYSSIHGLVDKTRQKLGGSEEMAVSYDMSLTGDSYSAPSSGAMGGSIGKMAPELMPSPGPDYSSGTTAEDFERKTYTGQIKTKDLPGTCTMIEALKEKSYVIFENSNQDDFNCSYQFKVEKSQTEGVLRVIQDLNPENLNANIISIKKSLEGVDTELDILTKKLQSIEETLSGAQTAYDEISKLATDQQNADVLAKVIDSKLNLIERLTSERLNIKSQIDYYNKNKADQMDELQFTFFNISVNKDVILDWKQLKENWKLEAQHFVENINHVLQIISLGLLTYLVYFALGIIYLFLSIFFLKFIWLGVIKIWSARR